MILNPNSIIHICFIIILSLAGTTTEDTVTVNLYGKDVQVPKHIIGASVEEIMEMGPNTVSDFQAASFMPNDTHGLAYPWYFRQVPEEYEGTRFDYLNEAWRDEVDFYANHKDLERPVVLTKRRSPFADDDIASGSLGPDDYILIKCAIWIFLRSSYFIYTKQFELYPSLMVLALIYMTTDLGHGLLHVVCDDIRNLEEEGKVNLLEGTVIGFQMHHIFPYHAGIYGYRKQVKDIARIFAKGLPFAEFGFYFASTSPLFLLAGYAKICFSALGQLGHMWAHRLPSDVPGFVFVLRRLGLLIGYHSHGFGHHLSHDRDFCILAGFPWNEFITWHFHRWQAPMLLKNVIALSFLILDTVLVYFAVKYAFKKFLPHLSSPAPEEAGFEGVSQDEEEAFVEANGGAINEYPMKGKFSGIYGHYKKFQAWWERTAYIRMGILSVGLIPSYYMYQKLTYQPAH